MLSEYGNCLVGEEKKRYSDKFSVIDNVHPFAIGVGELKVNVLPNVELPEPFNYLVLGTSACMSASPNIQRLRQSVRSTICI